MNTTYKPANAPEEAKRYISGPFHKQRPNSAYWAIKYPDGTLGYFEWEDEEKPPTISTGGRAPAPPKVNRRPPAGVGVKSDPKLISDLENIKNRLSLLETRLAIFELEKTRNGYYDRYGHYPEDEEEEEDVEKVEPAAADTEILEIPDSPPVVKKRKLGKKKI